MLGIWYGLRLIRTLGTYRWETGHIKSLDWKARKAEPAGRLPRHLLREVLDLLTSLLDM